MKPIFLLLTLFASVVEAQQVAQRPDIHQVLSTKVPHYAVKAENLLQAAAQIASDFDLPMGDEWQGDPAAAKEITREWDNTTVERILYDTAMSDIEYQIEVSDGVVHLRKTSVADSRRNPLSIKVPSFSVTNIYTGQAGFALQDQVNTLMFPREKQSAHGCAGSYGAGPDEALVTLSMTDASVRQILDALLTSSRSVMWLVIFRNEQSSAGFLKTQSLEHSSVYSEGPQWSFLAHYVDPATGKYRGDWKIGLKRP